jgi:thioredoxin reductase
VIGGSPEAVQHALLIRQWSADLVVFPHADELTEEAREQLAARDIHVVEGRLTRLDVNDDQLTGVVLDDGRVIARSAVFVRPQLVPKTDLLRALGCDLDPGGVVITDSVGRTSLPGVWAAGNASNPRAQVITAAGEGSAAAISINADLTDEDVRHAVRNRTKENS